MLDDEASLIRLAQQKDPSAFITLYERHQPAVYHYILLRIGQAEVADDLTADVFERLVSKVQTYTPQGRPLLAWLYTIAAHRVADYYRRQAVVRESPADETLRARDGNPVDSAHARWTLEMLANALQQLTEEQRQVVVLRFIEGRTVAEIAVLLDKNEGAVKALQHRALAALRRKLDKEFSYESLQL